MKLQRYVEYWVEEIDEYGDILQFHYQDNNKAEALKIARQLQLDPGIFEVSVERVESWGNDEEGIVRRRFQDVDIETGKLGNITSEG